MQQIMLVRSDTVYLLLIFISSLNHNLFITDNTNGFIYGQYQNQLNDEEKEPVESAHPL